MGFAENRSTDRVIEDLAAANPGDLARTTTVLSCFLKVLAAVLKRDPDYLQEAGDRFRHKSADQVINVISDCLSNVNIGHKLSRGHPTEKPKGLPYFNKAMSALQRLAKVKDFPAWLLIPLMTEVRAREASLYFYCEDYAEADKRFASAELELAEIMTSDDWPFEGVYDKQINLIGFHLSSFLVHSIRLGVGTRVIQQTMTDRFDSVTTPMVESALRTGNSHSQKYVAPLSKWVRDNIRTAALQTSNIPYDVSSELLLCDRYEYFVSCGKYLSNRAWIDLYLYHVTADPGCLARGRQRFGLSMNAVVEGAGRRDFAYYHVDPEAAERYCMTAEAPVREVQNSVARNLFYRMLFAEIAGESPSSSADMAWLARIHELDSARGQGYSGVVDSLAAGVRNASAIGLRPAALSLVSRMPLRLCGALSARVV